jgi:CRISPR-associated protein Csm2
MPQQAAQHGTSQNLWQILWKDSQNYIPNPEAFSKVAEEWARKISEEGKDDRGNAKRNKTSQLRKFYDELFKLNQRARMPEINWDTILPHVHMLIAKVAYAKGRDLVTDKFVSMLKDLLSQVKHKEQLHVVASFLEAFMAFYKQYRPRD